MRPVKENAEKTGAKRVGLKMGFYLGTPVGVGDKTRVLRAAVFPKTAERLMLHK